MPSIENSKQMARDYLKAFAEGDEAWFRQHIAPEYRRNDPGLPFEVRGPEGVKQLSDGFRAGILLDRTWQSKLSASSMPEATETSTAPRRLTWQASLM